MKKWNYLPNIPQNRAYLTKTYLSIGNMLYTQQCIKLNLR